LRYEGDICPTVGDEILQMALSEYTRRKADVHSVRQLCLKEISSSYQERRKETDSCTHPSLAVARRGDSGDTWKLEAEISIEQSRVAREIRSPGRGGNSL